MALNWNQEVSLSSIKNIITRGKSGAELPTTGYPTKTWMNLYQIDKKTTNLRTVVLSGVLVLVCLIAVLKFGVFDQLAIVSQKEAELEAQQELLLQVSSESEGYSDVKDMYEGYLLALGGDEVDSIRVLDLIEKQVKPAAQVSVITYADNTITLTLNNVSLETVGILAKQLENQDIVSTVNVSTAQNTEKTTVSTLVVTLVSPEGEEG